MEKWIQKLSGAVIASVLALTLSTKASADLMEDDPDPDQPLPQYEENTGEDTPAPSRGAPASDDEDGEDGKGEGDDSADPDEAGVITLSNIEDPADVTEFTPGEDDSVDLSSQTTDDPYDLFGFDAGEKSNDPDDDCFYMVDFDGSDYDLTSTDSDINIKAAGLNRLHGIYADGDVNLTGSGILLVDDIQLSEGCGFYLHPIAGLYDSGSVAVFRLQTPADTAGGANAVYELINGKDVPGILDEAYTVPDGVTLVVPANSSLILESLVQVTTKLHYDENDELVPASVITYPSESHPQFEFGSNYDYDFSTANLTIPESAGLVLEDGASMTSHTIPALSGKVVRPKVTVSGTLEGTGIISGGCFEFNGHASVDAAFQGGLMYNTALLYNNAQNIKLTITDSCSLISSAGSSISRIVLAPDASLECYVREGYPGSGIVSLNGGIWGDGKIVLNSGNYTVTDPGFFLEDSVTVSARAVTIEDISGNFTSAAGSAMSIIVDPDDAIMPDPATIPVLTANIDSTSHIIPEYSYSWAGSVPDNGNGFLSSYLITDGIVSFSDLADAYRNDFSDDAQYRFIEVYTISDGKFERHLIEIDESGRYTDGFVPADQIWLIRLVSLRAIEDSTGGGSIMSTQTSMTGSGILGGSGAGSITGGAGSSIFTGSGITNNSGSSDDDENSNDDDSNNDHAPVVNPQPGAQQNVVVTVTSNDDTAGQQAASLEELDTVYTVSASVEGHTVAELTGMVTVRFSCPAPETNVMIFAVFRDSNSSLKVFRARYDRITGQLVFECDMLGDFAVVCVDYKGDLTSDEFYALLESFDSVNKLH